MKKIFNTFIFILILFFVSFPNTYALNYSESEIIEIVKETENKSKEVITLLKDWSNTYISSVDSILDKDLISKLNTEDITKNIDVIINELKVNNKIDASNALLAIKNDLLNNYSKIKNNLTIIENYLINNDSYNVIENSDLFIQLKKSVGNLKPLISEIFDTYYNQYYSGLKEKIANCNTVSEIMSIYNEIINKITVFNSMFNTFENSINNWQNIYNLYNLSDFSETFNDYFGKYYNKIRNEYDKAYTHFENKMQDNLDEKIDKIVDDTDTSNYESIINRNKELTNIIDYIDKIKNDTITKFDKVNVIIKIKELAEKLAEEESKIIDRFVEAMKYTEEYIIKISTIMLKDEADKKYINIDYTNGLIIYNQTDLSMVNFLNRLFASFGNIKIENAYSNRIGTLSKVRLYYEDTLVEDYKLIVKGDIAPNGAFDITDVVNICNKMFNKVNFDMYAIIAADMNNDNKIDITDVVMLCNLLFK